MALRNDENMPPHRISAWNQQYKPSPLGLRSNVQAVYGNVPSTAAAHNSSCLGIVRPQMSPDSLERQLAAARQQIELEQCKSSQLQSQLQQAQCQLQSQLQQLASNATSESDLEQQLSISNKQLQQTLRSAAAAESARQRAARDCNHSAGIALKQVAHVQQLRQVVKQQALQLSNMQRQLHEVTVQLEYSRKLHAHTAALLSVRELQLAELQDTTQCRGCGTTATHPSKLDPKQQERVQQTQLPHTCPTNGCAASASEMQGAAEIGLGISNLANIPAGHHCEASCASECSLDSSTELSLPAETEEQGTSTPITTHPARPVVPAALSNRYKGSRLSLVDRFNAAAAIETDHSTMEAEAGHISGQRGVAKDAETNRSAAHQQNGVRSRKLSLTGHCRRLRNLLCSM